MTRVYVVGPATVDAVTRGYLTAAGWADTYHGDDPDRSVTVDASGFTPASWETARATVRDFLTGATLADAARFAAATGCGADGIGHDLWLTANRHGAGFWDRGTGEIGDRLTVAAHAYGETAAWVDAAGEAHLDNDGWQG